MTERDIDLKADAEQRDSYDDATRYQRDVLVTCCEYDDVTRLRMQTEIRAMKVRLGLMVELGKRMDELKRYVYYKKGDTLPMTADILDQYGVEAVARLQSVVEPLHGVIGKMTEIGEVCEAFLRFIFEGVPIDVVNVAEEIGDGNWYDVLLCEYYNLRFGDVLQGNRDKLVKRFAGKFTNNAALGTRDVKSEQALVAGAVNQPSVVRNVLADSTPYCSKHGCNLNEGTCPMCQHAAKVAEMRVDLGFRDIDETA